MKNPNAKGVIGLILLVAFISGSNHLLKWNTAELIGYNLVSLAELSGGIYLIYVALKRRAA